MIGVPDTTLTSAVSDWYARAARELPWRRPDVDPWAVLVSEVMLQQTQVARVLRAHQGGSRRATWKAAVDLFAKVGIVDPERRAHAYPHELSGGMAQRVVIAMALIAHPQVVLADDATLGLDATIQVQVLDLLVRRCRELGLGAVIITIVSWLLSVVLPDGDDD